MTYDDVMALLDRCTDLVTDTEARRDALQYAGNRAGVRAESILADTPEASGKPLEPYYDREDASGRAYKSKFKSFRQQRKVMALVKRGKVPYPRTGQLMASITSAAYIMDTGVVIRVGTNRSEAPFVLDESRQSHYHAGTWIPLQVQLRAHEGEILDEFGAALGGYIRGYLRRR